MKGIQKLLALLLFSVVSLTACQKSDDNSNANSNTSTPAAGTWKVSYFFDKQDKTSNYSNYTFEFGANGSLTASNGSQSWSGSWATGVDDSGNKFVINLGGTLPSTLEDLVEDWHIVKMDGSTMHFEHTSGGNGDTRVLKFIKI